MIRAVHWIAWKATVEEKDEKQEWLGAIAKSLAFLCIQHSHLKEKTTAQKALFLNSLGLTRKTIAEMLDSTPQSISELMRVSKNQKIKKGAAKRAVGNGKKKTR